MEELLGLVSDAVTEKTDWKGIETVLSAFVASMSSTEQNPEFHAEGDAWTHTKRVCEELVNLTCFRQLSREKQQVLFLAALLHDIGKIPATRWENGRWVSPNHSLVGSRMARQFLWQELGLCGTPEKQQLRETVCSLIRYHSFPPHAMEAPNGKQRLLSIAANGDLCPLFTVELLCILCRADALGRECVDKNHILDQVNLCEELAREYGCAEGAFPFPSDHTRYSCLAGKNVSPEVELYDDTWGEIILLSGLPGTGKDTWIRKNYSDLPMISLDEIRKEMKILPTENQSKVLEAAREQAREQLRKKQPFVWNATNLSPMVRSKQIRLFGDYHASTRIVWLETAWKEQLRRNAARSEAVPEQVICHMMEEVILPEAGEAHRVQWHCI